MCDKLIRVKLMGSIDELAPLTSSETDACQVLLTAPRLALSVPTLHIHTHTHIQTHSVALESGGQ